MQQLNNAAGCRSRGPLESPISGPNLDPWAKAGGRGGACSVGSKEEESPRRVLQ